MASGFAVASAPFDALPEPVLRVLFLALPVDARARAACVCRGWRAFLSDVSLWQVLDLSPAGGVDAERVTENLVRGAVGRAAGHLRVLTWTEVDTFAMDQLLVAVIVSDGAGLQQVKTKGYLSVRHLEAVFPAAPRLQALNAGVCGTCTELLPCLRNDPPYGPLRVSQLVVAQYGEQAADLPWLALAAAVAAHESLTCLVIRGLHIARDVNALVDAAAERRVETLSIQLCTLDAEFVPALERLVQRGSLTILEVVFLHGFPNAQEANAVVFPALRLCRTLKCLILDFNPHGDAIIGTATRTATELLDAAASLPALSELNLRWCVVQDANAFGHALGELLRANLPNLHTLIVYECLLGDGGLALVLDGLAVNTHLRRFACGYGNNLSEEFMRDRLYPALAALAARAELDT